MAKLVLQATDQGLLLTQEILQSAGVSPGDLVEIDVASLPTAREVQIKALRYVVWKLGDAIRVGQARWHEGVWVVELFDPEGELGLGVIVLNAHGELIPDRSATAESVRETFYAVSSPRPAA